MKRTMTLMIVAMVLSLTTLNGQDRSGWYLGAGWHFADYFAPIGGGWLETGNWNGDAIPMQFYLGRNLSNKFELGTSLSLMKLEKFPEPLVKENFLDWDIQAQYRFLGDRVAKGSWFDPYVWVGGGITQANDITSGLMNAGAGIDFWLTRFAAVNVHTAIDAALGNGTHYTHHGVGLKFLVKSCNKGGDLDTDGDGIPDRLDKCPTVKGTEKNHGCPEITAEKQKEIEAEILFNAKNIQFETGSDVIRQESFKDLDNIVMIMNRFPNASFDIHGHTDNTGGAALNLDLSKRRAASVKKYFVNKGIDASRLFTEGYGQDKPIATNDTPEGRAQNRRVEIKIRN
ncbi:MAG TPA: OmpA family protein [Bacteroidales bacterium]|nr:OmpA family protein [Bacteroidales bacterium]